MITLTESAAARVRSYIDDRGHGAGLRLGVRKSGCTGFAYVIDLTDDILPEDEVFEQHGVKVIVDRDSLPILEGTEVNFVQEGLNRMFKFDNPNVREQCGCGESFSV